MTEDHPLPAAADEVQSTGRSPTLIAVPDDREDPAEITFLPDDAADERLATAWITADVEAVVDLRERQ